MKVIKWSIIRTKTLSGLKCKTYVFVGDNGQVLIKSLFLNGWRDIEQREISFKASTFTVISEVVLNQKEGILTKYKEHDF